MAVEFLGVSKSYDRFLRKSMPVLNNVDLHVPAGQIFGLLGPSGCGKTTILRCLLGRLKADQGTITVLGKPLGSPDTGVPGSNVGYMPQELALVMELSIAETLWYFSRLVGMEHQKMIDRKDFLLKMLHLPKETRLIQDLSGGQRRRVSFAAALLHEPQLLILDEPTVGVDPLLRVSIWEHLLTVAHSIGSTIIITTHYIEEARKAHTVGLMRQGKMLVQAPPHELLETYNLTSLEGVFLHLCRQDKNFQASHSKTTVNTKTSTCTTTTVQNGSFLVPQISANDTIENQEKIHVKKFISRPVRVFQRISALTYRNFLMKCRTPMSTFLQVVVPAFCAVLFVASLGGKFHNMEVGVVNDDNSFLGGLYLKQLDSYILTLKEHKSKEEAVDSVRQREAWAAIYMHPNFTEATIERFQEGVFMSNNSISESRIMVKMDTINLYVTHAIIKELITSYKDFAADIFEDFNLNPDIADIPIIFEEPVYGDQNPQVIDTLLPGMIVQLTISFATFLTSLAFMGEHMDGLLDRTWVAGISRAEVATSHILCQGACMVCQVTMMLITTFIILKVPCHGPIILVILLVAVIGFTGICLGFIFSIMAESTTQVVLLQVAWFFSTTFMLGSLMPLQAMPRWLMYISYTLPQTLPTEGLKSILLRGWTMTQMQVWLPFVTSILWSFASLTVSGLVMRMG